MAEPTEAARRRSGLRLARLSFTDGETVSDLLSAPPLELWNVEGAEPADDGSANIVAALGRTADPDAAVALLAALVAAAAPAARRALRCGSALHRLPVRLSC